MGETQLVFLTDATLKTLARISERDGWELPSSNKGWSELLEEIIMDWSEIG